MAYYISSGQVSSGIILNNDSMYVYDGGTADSTTVNPWGYLYVSSGGNANGATVNSGGRMYVSIGGNANAVTIIEGGQLAGFGFSCEKFFSAIENGSAVISDNVIITGNEMYIGHNGTATNTAVTDQCIVYVSSGGTAGNTTLDDHGELIVLSGGTAESTTVFWGLVSVFGGTANSTTLNSDGIMEVSGGIANDTVLNIHAAQFVSSGGTACRTVVNAGTWQTVSSGGTANDTTVNAEGYQEVYGGGTANNTTANSGAIWIDSGGTASHTRITGEGVIYVASGGTAFDTAVDSGGGFLWVSSGGTAAGVTVNAGGRCFIEAGGTATEIIENGGYVQEDAGANVIFIPSIISGLVLHYCYEATLHSGTVSVDTVIDGGTLYVRSGGVAKNTVAGDLQVNSGGKVTGFLEILGPSAVFADAGAIVDFDISGRTPASDCLINNMAWISGTPVYTITLVDDQAEGIYALAGGAADFTGIVSIGTDGSNYGSLTVNADALNYGGYTFTLATTDSNLLLTVSQSEPAGGMADDLNGDGRADIVMTIAQNAHGAYGSTGAWLIQADQTAAWGDLTTRNSLWTIFGMGFTSAGKNTADVYAKSTGNVVGAWTTADDGKVNGWETIGEFSADTQIVGLGDFNGNGQTDLLLRNTNGAVGCFFTGGEKTGWNYFQSLGDEWKLSAVGDLNGDGRDDVVLKHDAGFAGSWLTQEDGTMAWADLDTLPDGFEIVGAGDFNADGTDDVLLKSGNYYGAWLVNNGNAAGWMGLGDLGDVTVEQIADFNGDGTDDLRIRTAAGDLGTQLVMGADDLVWKYYGSVGSEWSTGLAALA